MKRFNHLQALVSSFFSPEVYRDAAQSWKGAGLLYLLVITILCCIPVLIKTQLEIARFAAGAGAKLVEQIPTIAIRGGHVSTDVPSPYFIREPKTGAVVVIVDTSGTTTSLEGTAAKVLITRSAFMVRNSATETRTFDLSRVKHLEIGREKASRWLGGFAAWFTLLISPFAVAFSFLYREFQALIYAVIGLLIARMRKLPLPYAAVLRLTAVAFTPMMIVDAIQDVAGLRLPVWWLACSAIALAYIAFGLNANAGSAAPEPAPSVAPGGAI